MVPPNGVSAARSGSTWIHWSSPVASAKASMRSWVTSCHSLTPSSSPTFARSSSRPLIVNMSRRLDDAKSRLPLLVLAGALGQLRLALGGIRGGDEQLARRTVRGKDRHADRAAQRPVDAFD